MAYLKRNFSSNSVERTLQANFIAGSTTLTLDSDVGLAGLAFPYTLVIDPDVLGLEEIVTVLSRGSGYTFVVVRGCDGTTSVDHANGAKARHMITARDLQEPQNHVDATTAYTILNPNTDAAVTTANITLPLHGIASGEGAVVGTLKTQTLTNKTLTSPTLTGTPTAPTAAVTTNTTQIATTEFVRLSEGIPTYNAQTGTTYTFVLSDVGKTVTASNANPQTYTIPPQASVTWLADTTLNVLNLGAGVVTFAAGAGVTVTNAVQTLTQYQSARLVRTASDAWTVTPDSGGTGSGGAAFSEFLLIGA